jgi:hypothetical protein
MLGKGKGKLDCRSALIDSETVVTLLQKESKFGTGIGGCRILAHEMR